MESPEAVLHDLSLLLHSVRLEGLPGLETIAIRAGADSRGAVEQVPQLSPRAPGEVGQRAPRLILSAVGQLVREHRKVASTSVRQEHVVSQRDRPIPGSL